MSNQPNRSEDDRNKPGGTGTGSPGGQGNPPSGIGSAHQSGSGKQSGGNNPRENRDQGRPGEVPETDPDKRREGGDAETADRGGNPSGSRKPN